jgi:hypothetical protein
MKTNKRGEVWISAVLYTLIAVLALVLILEAGLPILERLKDRATFTKTKDVLLNLDKHIEEVANEGEGSQRIVSLEVKEGNLRFTNNQVTWEMETKNQLVDPRTSTTVGNLIITSNANVNTYETEDSYIMETNIENDTFAVKVFKRGSRSAWVDINTSDLIDYVSYNGVKMNGTFMFTLNNDPDSALGNGYTEMIPSGNRTNLGRAKVVAHVNSSFAEYDLELVLESFTDFVSTRIKNFEAK